MAVPQAQQEVGRCCHVVVCVTVARQAAAQQQQQQAAVARVAVFVPSMAVYTLWALQSIHCSCAGQQALACRWGLVCEVVCASILPSCTPCARVLLVVLDCGCSSSV